MKTALRISIPAHLVLLLALPNAGVLASTAVASTAVGTEVLSLSRQGKLNEARAFLENRVKSAPDDLQAANDLAVFLAALGDLESSRRTLESALLANPQSAAAFKNLREVANQQFAENYSKAIGKSAPRKEASLASANLDPNTVKRAVDEGRAALAAAEAARKEALAREEAEARARAAALAKASADKEGKSIEPLLRAWAKAWENKDFDRYASFYSAGFSIPSHPTLKSWLEFRKPRIVGKKQIVLELSNISVTRKSDSTAEVRFDQRYESGSLKVRSRKTQIWVSEGGSWKIQAEQN